MSLQDTMKNHMDAVRALGNSAGTAMTIDDATKALQALKLLSNHPLNFRDIDSQPFDLDSISKTEIDFVKQTGGVSTEQFHAPESGKWWYVVSLCPTSANALQIAFTDTGDALYTRAKTSATWQAWNKLGGVINPVLSAFKRIVAPLMGGVAYAA